MKNTLKLNENGLPLLATVCSLDDFLEAKRACESLYGSSVVVETGPYGETATLDSAAHERLLILGLRARQIAWQPGAAAQLRESGLL